MADVRISARSTLGTLNRWVEVISGNLVGSQIIGYKGTRISFGDSLVDIIRGGSGSTGNVGGINPVQIGSGGISVGGTTTDFKQGSLIQTGNNLDLAIQGNSFFTIADSSGKIIYTRAGEFSFDDQGYLVNKEGNFVLGLFDRTREIIKPSGYVLRDLDNVSTGGFSANFSLGTVLVGDNPTTTNASMFTGLSTVYSFGNVFGSIDQEIHRYLADPAKANEDRVVGLNFVPSGQLTVNAAGGTTASVAAGINIGIINGVTISFSLPEELNRTTRTSLDNAREIAKAINTKSIDTGVAASVVVNLNDQNQATIVLGHVNRIISESSSRIPTDPKVDPTAYVVGSTSKGDVSDSLTSNQTGLIRTYQDNKNNIFYAINSLTMFGKAPSYRPVPGDVYHFDGTGALINDSKGKDDDSAPPFNTGIHIAISKFANDQGLQRRRGGSQFLYTEAVGGIVVGFAGLAKTSQVSTSTGVEENGSSAVGVENVIISQALESSNTSVTDALPELTVAQKTFTANTKVVNVGNTIVDDLNGLIR